MYDLTGFAVEVMTDQSQQVRASLRSAGPGQPGHLICLGASCESQADYWLAIECFQLLRMWAVPYEEQVTFQPDEQKKLYLANQLERMKTYKRHPREIITGMAQRRFFRRAAQVRSYPVELPANRAMIREFPALGQQQRVAAMSMLQENSRTLAPEVKSRATAQVDEATCRRGQTGDLRDRDVGRRGLDINSRRPSTRSEACPASSAASPHGRHVRRVQNPGPHNRHGF